MKQIKRDVCYCQAGDDEIGVVNGIDVFQALVDHTHPFPPVFYVTTEVQSVPTSMTLIIAF